jgi:hypothetical protein
MFTVKVKTFVVPSAVVGVLVMGGVLLFLTYGTSKAVGEETPAPATVEVESGFKAQPVAGIPADFPIAKGFPVALPGAIIASPVIADLEGNGNPVILVPCVQRAKNNKLVHSASADTPLIFAIRPDGTTVKGWPMVLGRGRFGRPNYWGGWNSTPAVIPSKTGDLIAMVCPGGMSVVITPKREVIELPPGVDDVSSPLVVTLAGPKKYEVMAGRSFGTVTGERSNTWPRSAHFRDGYTPCVGDAFGDGHAYLYHLFYTNHGSDLCNVGGFDEQGRALDGWPRLVEDPTWFGPVMGDITGSGKMSVVIGTGQRIHAWNADGKPVPGAHTVTTKDGDIDGVLVDDVSAASSRPTLADLDGDGKAEVIIFDPARKALRAWYGDGKPFGKFKDGVIAKLDYTAQGVSVVSLGDDPKVMDFFLGVTWVRLKPDGTVTITQMLPKDETPNVEWMQPTVCDLFVEGKANVLFGTSDGRLVVYNTGLAFHSDRAQWATAHGNFQHTASWSRPVVELP